MFLNNFFKILALNAIMGGNAYVDSAQCQNISGTYRRIAAYACDNNHNGNANHTVCAAMSNVRTNYSGTSYYGVYFGNGTTPVSATDHKLSGSIISTISTTSKTTYSDDTSGFTYSTLYTITNTGSANITISEVGMSMMGYYCDSSGGSITTNEFLVERTLLDTPITIAPNGVGQVTYTIRINYPVL